MNPNYPQLGLEALLYDAFMSAEEPEDVEFFVTMLDGSAGPALELGCGSGRVLIDLLAQGYPVEGLDADEKMLACAQARAEYLSLAVELHHSKMEEFQPSRQYASLYAPGFSFQLLSHYKQALMALKSWQNWLLPEGQILLTCYWPWEADEGLEQTDWELYNQLEGEFLQHWLESAQDSRADQATQARCYTRSELDLQRQQLTRFHRYQLLDKQGQVLAQEHSALKQAYWKPEQLQKQAQELGYTQATLLSGFTPSPFESGDSLWTLKLTMA